jgi:hypothetical protein
MVSMADVARSSMPPARTELPRPLDVDDTSEYVNVIQDHLDGLIQGHHGSMLSTATEGAQYQQQCRVLLPPLYAAI